MLLQHNAVPSCKRKVVWSSWLLLQMVASAQGPYTTTLIDFPGGTSTDILAGNARIAVIGSYSDANGGRHAFYRDASGQFATLVHPGSLDTVVTGINSNGMICGNYTDANAQHGFIRDAAGTFTTIDFPGAKQTTVLDINDSQTVVGFYNDSINVQHSFIRDAAGVFTFLDVSEGKCCSLDLVG